jgi:hypothetical protein
MRPVRIASANRSITDWSVAYTAEVCPSPSCSVTSSQAAIPCSTDGERTTPRTGISFSAMNGCASSSVRSVGSVASSTLVSSSAVNPASSPSRTQDCPSAAKSIRPSGVKDFAARSAVSAVLSTRAPIRWNSAIIAS